jgi:predicted amidophosphoribosyltransferase
MNQIIDEIDWTETVDRNIDFTQPKVCSVASYYTTPRARELAHSAKVGSLEAIRAIAIEMAPFVSRSAILVPIPSRSGKPTSTLELVHAIAALAGCLPLPLLYGRVRSPSLYELKKQGVDPNTVEFGFRTLGDVPDNLVLVDFVRDTGATMRAAKKVLPFASEFTYAVVDVKRTDLDRLVRSSPNFN